MLNTRLFTNPFKYVSPNAKIVYFMETLTTTFALPKHIITVRSTHNSELLLSSYPMYQQLGGFISEAPSVLLSSVTTFKMGITLALIPSIKKTILYCNKILKIIKGDFSRTIRRFAHYYYIGLGYKIFRRKDNLYIWVGLTHYTLLLLPPTLRVFTKKRRIYLLGSQVQDFKNFMAAIRRVRKTDIYKGKGLLEVKTYKGFLKMKTGKKKQY